MTPDFLNLAMEMMVGLGAGIVSGLMGIGGGPILIPAAVFLLGVDQHTAQGVSLAVIVPTAMTGAITHFRQGFVVPKTVAVIGSTAVVFAMVSAQIAGMIDEIWLGRVVGALIIFVGGRMLLGK